jgi:hypothetical protein
MTVAPAGAGCRQRYWTGTPSSHLAGLWKAQGSAVRSATGSTARSISFIPMSFPRYLVRLAALEKGLGLAK